MTLADVMLVTTNSCTLLIIPKENNLFKDMVICNAQSIPVEYLDYIVDKVQPIDKNLLKVRIWK